MRPSFQSPIRSGATIMIGNTDESPAARTPTMKNDTAKRPATGSNVAAMSSIFSNPLPCAKSAPAATAMTEPETTNMSDAETIESRRSVLMSSVPHPFSRTSSGRVTNVGAAIVVPTNAASIRSDAPSDGASGRIARLSVAASGHVANTETMNVSAIRNTKNARTFSKNE